MNTRLHTLLAAQDGVLSTADAASVGVDVPGLRRACRNGELVRIRRGAYADAQLYAAATHERRYRFDVKAILRSRPGDAASHHAALVLAGVPTYDVDLGIVDISSTVAGTRRQAGVRVHPPPTHYVPRGMWLSVPLPLALVQVGASSGLVAGVCSMDHALFRGWCTHDRLQAAALALPGPRARKAAFRALERVDGAAESVGETRTRLVLTDLGFGCRSQVRLDTDQGPARVDLLIDDLVVVEFDGLIKYAGADGRDALTREKLRESALVRLGYEVERIIWSDLNNPAALARRIHQARTRALSRRHHGDAYPSQASANQRGKW